MIQIYNFSGVNKLNITETIAKAVAYFPRKAKSIYLGKELYTQFINSNQYSEYYDDIKVNLNPKYNGTQSIEITE